MSACCPPSSSPLTPPEKRLETAVETATLAAYYGALLTGKQREALRLHCEEDLSLGEIAEQLGVSRQNVHELIFRSAEKLRAYEAALGTARRMTEMRGELEQALDCLHAAQAQGLSTGAAQRVARAEALLTHMLERQEEDDHGV